MSAGDGLARLREALDDHGCTVRGTTARCPAHDDRHASLSIGQGRAGALVKCHGGCPTDAVLEALGMSAADLFDTEREPGRTVTATYAYTDEYGAPLFYVERREPKDFRQYKLVNGEKVWRLGDVRRVPYHLPALLQGIADGRTIYVVEGEKDVHAVEAAGGVATCNPGGAGKWRAEYSGWFAGAQKVLVVADRDKPGRAHAGHVSRTLRPVAGAVKVVEAAAGKDASDHLAAGYGLEDFRDPDPGVPVGTTKEERRKPPPVPVADPAMFAGILGEITAAAAPATEADPAGIYVSLLAGTGAVIGPGPHVVVGNTRHPLLIWGVLLGRTGTGRKGEAGASADIFLRQAAPDTMSRISTSGLSSGEGLIEAIKADGGGDEQGRLLVTESEFASVMARARREGSTLAQVLRLAWDGRPLKVMNREQVSAPRSHIAILGHISPREFRMRLADADMSGGTYNRFLPVYVERSRLIAIPEPTRPQVLYDLGGKLAAAIEKAAKIGQIQFSLEAEDLWRDELYPEFTLSDDDDRAESEFTRRAAPYCLRTAGMLAALDGQAVMTEDNLAAAAALVRYSLASARFVLDRQLRDPRLDRICRAVDTAGPDGLTRSAVAGLFSRNLTKEVLDELLLQATETGNYEMTRRQTAGRPADIIRHREMRPGLSALRSFFFRRTKPLERNHS